MGCNTMLFGTEISAVLRNLLAAFDPEDGGNRFL
jgi:hypothetical protein